MGSAFRLLQRGLACPTRGRGLWEVTDDVAGWVAGLAGLKAELEQTMEKVFEIYIRTTPERLWDAITDPDTRAKYNFGARQESAWTEGSSFTMAAHPGGQTVLLGDGVNLEVDPPRRLVQSMTARWSDEVAAEGTSRITWEIEKTASGFTRLTVTHDLTGAPTMAAAVSAKFSEMGAGGWSWILSDLKTLLETGSRMA